MDNLPVILTILVVLVVVFELGRLWQWLEDQPGMSKEEADDLEQRLRRAL